MNNQEIFELIKNTTGCASGNLAKFFYKNENYLQIIIDRTSFLPVSSSLIDRFYYIRNDLYEIKKCKNCNKPLSSNLKANFCSCKCNACFQNKSLDVLEKRKVSMTKTYNEKTQEEKDLIKIKRKETNIKRYGVENNMHAPGIKEKKIETWEKNYGVNNPVKSDIIKTKIKNTNIKKYGGPTPFSGEEQKAQRTETWLNKYGVDNPVKNPEVQQKMKDTYKETTGYEHPMKNPEVVKKIRKTFFNNEGKGKHKKAYKYKVYTFLSGRQILVQGYEGGALDNYLLKIYKEEDIENNIKLINSFNFEYGKTVSGIKRKYIPDFYIQKDNLFIEVKSQYFFDKQLNDIYLKAKSVIEKGFDIFILVSKDNKKFKKITYEEIKISLEKRNS